MKKYIDTHYTCSCSQADHKAYNDVGRVVFVIAETSKSTKEGQKQQTELQENLQHSWEAYLQAPLDVELKMHLKNQLMNIVVLSIRFLF